MRLSIFYSVNTVVVAATLFVLMIALIILGRRLSKNRVTPDHSKNPGNAAMTTSLYALLGLLLAFTFGMSGDRFRVRRLNIVEESNAISTAALRVQLYADSVQPALRKLFREYLETRIAYFEAGADTMKISQSLQRSQDTADALWLIAASNSRHPSNFVASNQMVPALNQMFDTANSRFWSEYNRTPSSILTMLFLLCLSSAFVAGHTSVGEGKFDWFMAVGFCLLISIVIYFIIDLDKPRAGIITLEENARAISDLRRIINE
ncbi:MAG TPA: hypothetical protein VK658_02335 [Chryseolinea sp.]|nr:hypothetical protein [Chryseolinea sp.]